MFPWITFSGITVFDCQRRKIGLAGTAQAEMERLALSEKEKRMAAKAKLEARRQKLDELQQKELIDAGVAPEVSLVCLFSPRYWRTFI
eukprot:SAG31_NODE_2434_length_5705_cov_6.754014_3_plen_88_part_00